MTGYGVLTGSAVGTLMKETVRRAIMITEGRKLNLEIIAKQGIGGKQDLLTNADREAQNMYAHKLAEDIPGIGLVGEEDDLHVIGYLDGRVAYFTMDGVDGTKALADRMSHGVGTMLSFVVDGVVVAAYVGDVNTHEIYGYRPGSSKAHRISSFEFSEPLMIDPARELSQQRLLIRTHPAELSECAAALAMPGDVFKDMLKTGGSIGISMAQLWKGEVGGAILDQGKATLWDMCPIWGISRQLGFVFIDLGNMSIWEYQPDFNVRVADTPAELLVIHQSRLDELRSMMAWPSI